MVKAQDIIDGVEDEDSNKIVGEAGNAEDEDYFEVEDQAGPELVKDAVSDLDKEINRIKTEKFSLDSEMESLDMGFNNSQQLEEKLAFLNMELRNLDHGSDNSEQLERSLQEKISKLEARKASLVDKKKRLKKREDSLAERLSKVKTIKDQLTEA